MERPPVQYVTTSDGFRLACSVIGKGIPWIVVPVGFNHIGLMSQIDAYRPWLTGLAERYKLVQFDGRGQGLSTRNLTAYSQDDRVLDLGTVVDHLKLEPAVLLGIASAGHPAIRFAARRPERVRALVLMSCSVTSEPWSPAIFDMLASADWQSFLRTVSAGGKSVEEARVTAELISKMVTQADFIHMARTWVSRPELGLRGSHVDDELKRVRPPALVLYPQNGLARLESSAELASSLAQGRLVEISGGGEPPWGVGDFAAAVPHIESLIAESAEHVSRLDGLSQREVEVIVLLAKGRSNQQIAAELVLSVRTVERHINHIYAKAGVGNRVEAARYARDQGLA